MKRTKHTHVHHVLLEASGSMQDCYDSTLSTLNEQIASMRELQKQFPEQDVKLSISDLSDDYRMWFGPKSVAKIRDVGQDDYQLRGCTALWDGLGTLITRTVDHLGEDAPDKGTTVSIMVLTDGYENASRVFSAGALRMLIDRLTQKGWEFRFIGADVDPLAVSRELGIDARRTARFSKAELSDYSDYATLEMGSYLTANRSRF